MYHFLHCVCCSLLMASYWIKNHIFNQITNSGSKQFVVEKWWQLTRNAMNGHLLLIQSMLFAVDGVVFAHRICPGKYLQNIMLAVISHWRLVKWNNIKIYYILYINKITKWLSTKLKLRSSMILCVPHNDQFKMVQHHKNNTKQNNMWFNTSNEQIYINVK